MDEVTRWIESRLLEDERRPEAGTGNRRSWRYDGCLFRRVLNVSEAILYLILWDTGSQCNFCNAGEM